MAYETEYTDFDPQEDSSACLTLGLATDIVESRYLRDFSTAEPEEKQQIGVKDGLVVADAAGPAAEAGITQGDVLLSINGSPAGDIEAVRAAMAKAGKTVAVLIWRDGNRIFVPVRLG